MRVHVHIRAYMYTCAFMCMETNKHEGTRDIHFFGIELRQTGTPTIKRIGQLQARIKRKEKKKVGYTINLYICIIDDFNVSATRFTVDYVSNPYTFSLRET